MKNCVFCGRFTLNVYCSDTCKNALSLLLNKEKKAFYSYAQAAKYLHKDKRTIRKLEGIVFVIDKTIPNAHSKLVACRVCNQFVKSQFNRKGFCKSCSKNGEGRKSQSKFLSEAYRGENNPNFVDGKSAERANFRQTQLGKRFVKSILNRDKICVLSKKSENLQVHHILPVALFPEYKLKEWNCICLNSFYHIELHRQQLDVVLLPSLYESLQDAQALIATFLRQSQVQELLQLPYKQHQKHELLRVVPRNYHKLLQNLHPEFAQLVLNRQEFQS